MSAEARVYWGITGHRRIASPEIVLDRILREGEALLGHYSNIHGLTPLAEGADRLFAEALLQLGIPYHVPLPLAEDNYKKDFPLSGKQFQHYLNHAKTVFTLPRCPWLMPDDILDQGEGRNFQYLSVGTYLIHQCDVLFSIWDGHPARGIGGTAQITELYRDFSRLKPLITTQQYNYFSQLGTRKTLSKKLILIDVE